MNKKNPNMLLCILLTLSACSKPDSDLSPIAEFRINDVAIDDDENYTTPTLRLINLENNSKEADRYTWNFGNSLTSEDRNPTIFYKEKGIYTVELTAWNKFGNFGKTTKEITVTDRKLYAIQVTNLMWQNGLSHTLFVRIYHSDNKNATPPLIRNRYDAPISYESKPVTALHSAINPINLDLPPGHILLPTKENLAHVTPEPKRNYGYCVYTLQNGQEHLLISSWDNPNEVLFNDNLSTGYSVLTVRKNGITAAFYATNNR